jgi:hypothetical protein
MVYRGTVRRAAMSALACIGLLLGACHAKEAANEVPTATVPQGTTTTNPYALPAVIDEAYVNRVLAGLDQAAGDFGRLVISTKSLLPETIDRLNALYIGEHLQFQLDLIAIELRTGFPNYRQPAGDRITTVTDLIYASPVCIFAKVLRDYSKVSVKVFDETTTQWVELLPADMTTRYAAYNPTGWVFAYDGFQSDRSAPENPCVHP